MKKDRIHHMTKNPFVIAIVGPTAMGKSALAVALARKSCGVTHESSILSRGTK